MHAVLYVCLPRSQARSSLKAWQGKLGETTTVTADRSNRLASVRIDHVKTKFILIDYENIHTFFLADLSALKENEFMVKLFLGVHNKADWRRPSLMHAPIAKSGGTDFDSRRLARTPLTFWIAFSSAKLWSHESDSTFYIVSKDTDYDALIKNLKTIGVDVHRRKCIADITKGEAIPSMSDLIAPASASLRRFSGCPSAINPQETPAMG